MKTNIQSPKITEMVTYSGLLVRVGETYIIDKNFRNGGEVELVHIYGKHFCKVRDNITGAEWDTMLYRLSSKDCVK